MQKTVNLIVSTALWMVIAGTISSCKKPTPPVVSTNPESYLPTLLFDGTDYFDSGERSFPVQFNFNTTQDGNNDGTVDVEDNLENYVPFAIGNNINGAGTTGRTNRTQCDQRPSIYFHRSNVGVYTVFEYWLYYADNDWLNDHEHDWEKYFVYLENGVPKYIKLSSHDSFNTVAWADIAKDDDHPMIAVDGGAHSMKNSAEDGVKIRYNGEISKNNGRLDYGDGASLPWVIYSNDPLVSNSHSYSTSVDYFFYGDPHYGGANELADSRDAPWNRSEWNTPPAP